MMKHRWAIIGVCLYSFLQTTTPEALLSVRFLTFRNPRGLDNSGRCCDESLHKCSSPCDHSFTICLDQMDGPLTDINHCTYGQFVSSGIKDTNYINFKDKIADINNPLLWRFRFWPGHVLLKVDVVDVDYQGAYDHVAYLYQIISAIPVNSQHGSRLAVVNSHHNSGLAVPNTVELTLEVRVTCGRNYYSIDCGVFCQPRDDYSGHYICDQVNGTKMCLDGWTGKYCDINWDDCLHVKCQNRGVCLDLLDTFRCQCHSGFQGRYCEEDINECSSYEVCRHGDCYNTPGSFFCTCHDGYIGRTCNLVKNNCLYHPCQNGGTCASNMGRYVCNCPTGFTGHHCESNINECLNDVCKNGASCIDLAGSFECVCTEFWEGRTCEHKVIDHLSNPQRHNCSCDNCCDRFLCHSSNGYRVIFCEKGKDERRTENICNNNVTFICIYLEGWKGSSCEKGNNSCPKDIRCNTETCKHNTSKFYCEWHKDCSSVTDVVNKSKCELWANVCRNNETRYTLLWNISWQCSSLEANSVFDDRCNKCLLDIYCRSNNFTCNGPSSHDNSLGALSVSVQLGYLFQNNKDKSGICYYDDDNDNLETLIICCPGESLSGNNASNPQMVEWSSTVFLHFNPDCMCSCVAGWVNISCDVKVKDIDYNSSDRISLSDYKSSTTIQPDSTNMAANQSSKAALNCSRSVALNQTSSTSHPGNIDESLRVCLGSKCLTSQSAHRNSTAQDKVTRTTDICTSHNNVTNTANIVTHRNNMTRTSSSRTHGSNVTSAVNSITPRKNITRTTNSKSPRNNVTKVVNSGNSRRNVTRAANNLTIRPNNVSKTMESRIIGISHERSNTSHASEYLELSAPFLLNCQISAHNSWILDQAIKRFVRDTGLFKEKTITVGHISKLRTMDGRLVTSIVPVITVDNKTLSISETNHVLKQGHHPFIHYFPCPQRVNRTIMNVTFSAMASNSSTHSWYPAVVATSILLMLLLSSLILLKCWRRKMKKKRTFKIRSIEVNSSIRKQSNAETDQQGNEINSVATQHAPNVSTTRESQAVLQHRNIVEPSNEDGEACLTMPDRRHHGSTVDIFGHHYSHLSDCEEFSAEVHAALSSRNSQLVCGACEMRRAFDEYDKYRSLPYIDDPPYMQISLMEGQNTQINVKCLK